MRTKGRKKFKKVPGYKKKKKTSKKGKSFLDKKRRTSIRTTTEFLGDFFLNKTDSVDKSVSDMYEKFVNIEKRNYYIIGYGSLMNSRSRERTFNSISEIPALIKGWRRIFNCSSVKGGTVLNVESCDTTNSSNMSVVITEVEYTEVFDMLMREFKYDIVEVEVEDVLDVYGDPIELESKPLMVVMKDEHKSTKDPIMEYVNTCLYGVASFDKEVDTEVEGVSTISNNFLDTTYLADGTTKLGDWLAEKSLIEVYKQHDSTY